MVYTADVIARKGLLTIEKKERKFLREIPGTKTVAANEFSYHLRSNQGLYERTGYTKGRTTFKGKKNTSVYLGSKQFTDLETCGITDESTENRIYNMNRI